MMAAFPAVRNLTHTTRKPAMPDDSRAGQPALTEAERERLRRRVMTTRKVDLWSLIWRENPWQGDSADGLAAGFQMADTDWGN